MNKTTKVAVFASFAAGILLVGGTWAYAVVTNAQLSACVKRDGDTRILIPGFSGSSCNRGEQLVTWNITGQQGPKGDKGDTGASGAQGATGTPGQIGATGPQGIQGLTGVTGTPGVVGQDGVQGLKGEKGDNGINGSQRIEGDIVYFDGTLTDGNGGTFFVNAGSQIVASASCPDGKVLLGGGGYVHGFAGQGSWPSQATRVVMQDSYPLSSTTWTVGGIVISNLASPSSLHPVEARAYAICTL